MKIAYDYQTFSLQQRGGISRYFCELISSLTSAGDCEITVLAFAHMNAYLNESGLPYIGRYMADFPHTMRLRLSLNKTLTRAWLRTRPPDVIHQTYYLDAAPAQPGVPIVVTVHDMIHEKFPSLFVGDPTARRKADAVRAADAVICVSESTRSDLVEYLDVDPAKVHVVHHGCSFGAGATSRARLIDAPYLLYVGHRAGYKNWAGLISAIGSSQVLRSNFKLICCGGPPFSKCERSLLDSLLPGSSLAVHMSCNDQDLATLYSHAAALVYPSLYEGFGMTPLEAMAQGCPVVCSRTSSLPEVVGDAAVMFDPCDSTTIAAAIESVVLSSELSAKLRASGAQRVRAFTWDTCATKTLDVYRGVIKTQP